MGNVLTKGDLFSPELVTKVISLVKGKSALAALSSQEPISFVGNDVFTFTLDNEINIVGENGAKTNGGATITPKTIKPIKVEYGVRISDELLYATEDRKVELLAPLFEGMANKFSSGLDIMAMHGVNPRTGEASDIIGTNNFDSLVENVVEATADADADAEAAIALVQDGDRDVSGMAMSNKFKASLAALKDNVGRKIYPDLAWGKMTGTINGLPVAANKTVSFNNNADLAIVGDFENMFKWGYAKDMKYEVIEYGNPDNDAEAGDLKGHNQVFVRAEAYLGWGILDATSFAKVEEAASL